MPANPTQELDAGMPAELESKMRADAQEKEKRLPPVAQRAAEDAPPPGEPLEPVVTAPVPEPTPPPGPDPYALFQQELAQRDKEIAELRQWQKEQQRAGETEAERREEAALLARQEDIERQILAATEAGDGAGERRLMFEHQKLQRQVGQKQSERMLKELRAPAPVAPPVTTAPTADVRAQRQAELFIDIHKLSPGEIQRMGDVQRELVAQNPKWAQAEPWHRFEAALRKVRPGRAAAPSGEAPTMEGTGASSASRPAPSLANHPSLDQGMLAKAARMTGYTQADYAKLVDKARKEGR